MTIDIHTAAHQGNLDRVKELIAKNPNIINLKNGDGETPLINATRAGQEETVKFLLSRNAEIFDGVYNNVVNTIIYKLENTNEDKKAKIFNIIKILLETNIFLLKHKDKYNLDFFSDIKFIRDKTIKTRLNEIASEAVAKYLTKQEIAVKAESIKK